MYCSQAITQADTSPCGCAGGYALTRQDCDPDMCRGDCPPLGSQTTYGEPRYPLKPIHVAAFLDPPATGPAPGAARVAAALAAVTAFSHMLGEGRSGTRVRRLGRTSRSWRQRAGCPRECGPKTARLARLPRFSDLDSDLEAAQRESKRDAGKCKVRCRRPAASPVRYRRTRSYAGSAAAVSCLPLFLFYVGHGRSRSATKPVNNQLQYARNADSARLSVLVLGTGLERRLTRSGLCSAARDSARRASDAAV